MVDFKIKTITPVHIGSGDIYKSFEYFLDTIDKNNQIYSIFNRVDLIKYFNSLTKNDQEKLCGDLLNPKYKLPKISNEFSRYYSYNKCESCPKPGNEIHENIKIMDKPYIPGSSIKGAIENALIYNSLTFNDIENIFVNGKIEDSIIKKFFLDSNKSQNNIMSFLQISDSDVSSRPYIFDIQTIKVEKNGKFKNQMKLYYETIVSNGLSASLTTNFDSKIYESLNLEDKEYLLDIEYIKESLYNFANDYIEFEIEFSKKYNIKNSENFYIILKRMNSIENPIIRLGSTTGLLSSAVIFKIKIHSSIDYFKKIKRNIGGRQSKLEYPITRRVVNKSKHPTGWAQLLFK